jgi:hypothetical protein
MRDLCADDDANNHRHEKERLSQRLPAGTMVRCRALFPLGAHVKLLGGEYGAR